MKKYIEYLPEYLRNIEELKAIGDAEDIVVGDEEIPLKNLIST